MRTFDTGATRNNDQTEPDYKGFYSPQVMQAFAQYMHDNRYQADGTMRDSDNWKKGIPMDAYMSSGFRHFMDWYSEHEGAESREGMVKALCGLLFNVQGYLHEYLKSNEQCRVFTAENKDHATYADDKDDDVEAGTV